MENKEIIGKIGRAIIDSMAEDYSVYMYSAEPPWKKWEDLQEGTMHTREELNNAGLKEGAVVAVTVMVRKYSEDE